jgi:small subunit ribosomal protein S17
MRLGVVVSDKGDKTIRVRYDFMVKHDKYGKFFRRSSKLAAHDEKNEAHVGDLVELMACRPISKTKTWRLVRVVRPAGEM